MKDWRQKLAKFPEAVQIWIAIFLGAPVLVGVIWVGAIGHIYAKYTWPNPEEVNHRNLWIQYAVLKTRVEILEEKSK